LPGEEDNKDCLVSTFLKLQTIMVWGCIKGRVKSPLIFWNKAKWGKTINATNYSSNSVLLHLYPFWQQQSRAQLDYVYLMQDNVSSHCAIYTQKVLKELEI
jgi:hypothetical protein